MSEGVESFYQGAHHCVEYGNREWVALENSNLQLNFLCCPGRCCDCRTKVGVEIGHHVDQFAGGVVVVKGEVNQLVMHTAVCICKV